MKNEVSVPLPEMTFVHVKKLMSRRAFENESMVDDECVAKGFALPDYYDVNTVDGKRAKYVSDGWIEYPVEGLVRCTVSTANHEPSLKFTCEGAFDIGCLQFHYKQVKCGMWRGKRFLVGAEYNGNSIALDAAAEATHVHSPLSCVERRITNDRWVGQESWLLTGREVVALDYRSLSRECIAFVESNLPQGNEPVGLRFEDATVVKSVRGSIAPGKFKGQDSLRSITFDAATVKIGKDAFRGCTELQSVVIPAGIKEIESGAFLDCPKLTAIRIEGNLPERLWCFTTENVKKIEFGPAVSEFWGIGEMPAVDGVQLPPKLKKIGEGAFSGWGLTEITIPKSVVAVGHGAFSRCKYLRKVEYLGIAEIDGAFNDSPLISEAIIADDADEWNRVFSGKANVRTVHKRTLGVLEWCIILKDQPQLSERCSLWRKFTDEEWPDILVRQPQFADRCDKWRKMDPWSWGRLLAAQPQFADRCDKWNGFSKLVWRTILSAQPQFASRCCLWNEFSGNDWSQLLSAQPQFAEQCTQWGLLSGENWCVILSQQPQFAERCNKWDLFSASDWSVLLSAQPQFAAKFEKWHEFSGSEWSALLSVQPQFAAKCNFDSFNTNQWSRLISTQPQFAAQCDKWPVFRTSDWADLLSAQPQFSERCDKWSSFGVRDWVRVLAAQPQFAERCDKWDAFMNKDWCALIGRQPSLAKHCKWWNAEIFGIG